MIYRRNLPSKLGPTSTKHNYGGMYTDGGDTFTVVGLALLQALLMRIDHTTMSRELLHGRRRLPLPKSGTVQREEDEPEDA